MAAAVSLTGMYGCTGSEKKQEASVADDGAGSKDIEWPVTFGADKPKMCMMSSLDRNYMRKVKQIGVNHLLCGGPQIPWTETSLRNIMDQYAAEDLTVINMMIGGFNKAIYGLEGQIGRASCRERV